MYRLSVPIMNRIVTKENRRVYAEQCHAADVNRVFLVPEINFAHEEAISPADFQALQENLRFFAAEGFETALWVGNTIGHGGLAHENGTSTADFHTLVNADGDTLSGTFCPLDTDFQKNVAAGFALLAKSGVDLILIDDDFRLCQHGPSPCCFCDLHLARVETILNEKVTRSDFVAHAFADKPNRYRDAYFQAQGDSLLELARVIRAAVDGVDPEIGLALCSCHSIWDIDGTTPLELTKIFAGKHAPVLRLHGAPYWATISDKSLPCVLEIARMFASFCHGKGIELLTENDSYPRPRYHTPAATMELHDAVLRADGVHQGCLKYMFDYVSTPTLETGYLDRHCADLDALRQIETIFEGTEQAGVRVEIQPQVLRHADLSLTNRSDQSPFPVAGSLLAQNGFSTTYVDKGTCRAVFGEAVRLLPNEDMDGVTLDAAAAILLTERGVDVGLPSADLRAQEKECMISFLQTVHCTERTLVWNGNCRLLTAPLKQGAEPLLLAEVNGALLPLCYRYENQAGQRFAVWLFNASYLKFNSDLLQGYLQQRALKESIEWLSRQPLAAYCEGNHPHLYLLSARKGDSLSVLLANCFSDSVLRPVVTLDRTYREIEFVRCQGRLDGNRVYLEDLPAFGFCAIRVKA